MTQRRFVYVKTDGDASAPIKLADVSDAAERRVHKGDGLFAVSVNGKPVREQLRRQDALDAFDRSLRLSKIGDTVRIRNGAGVIFSAREAKPAVTVLETNGNDKADAYWTAVKDEFPRCTYLGSYVCKDDSEHRFGNAVDAGFSSVAMGEDMAHWAIRNAKQYDIRNVIWQTNIWHLGTVSAYGGVPHVTHTHADFDPTYSTALPCGVLPKAQG